MMIVLRLDPEDIGVRPLPVLGAYGEVGVGVPVGGLGV